MSLLPERRKDFVIKDGRIHLTPEYMAFKAKRKFKKITGTRMAAVLGKSRYNSPAMVWADIVGIYKEEVDPMAVEAGNMAEPLVRDFVEQSLKMKFKSYDAKAIGYDAFKENQYFGGIPDGEQIGDNGEFLYASGGAVLEIKTASRDKFSYRDDNGVLRPQRDPSNLPKVARKDGKLREWFPSGISGPPSVPVDYQEQIKLYMYLRNAQKAILVVAFLEPTDYVPELSDFDPRKRIVKAIGFSFDRSAYEADVKRATDWYEEFVLKGVSPPLTEDDVAEWAH